MRVVTSSNERDLSNSYLVAEPASGAALLVDGGTPTAPIHAAVAELGLRPTHLLVTHRHPDHIAHLEEYATGYGLEVWGHRAEAEACGGFDRELEGGEELALGDLRARALHVPGHTAGHLAVHLTDAGSGTGAVFTGDTLFAGSVGGTRGRGHTCFEDLRHSVLEVILALPPETTIYPGHRCPTSVAEELEHNLFVRAWRGLDPPTETPCLALGEPATLLLRAPDYDGGTKCWVRFDAGGQLDVVPGSRVEERPGG